MSAGDTKEPTVVLEHARNLFGPITGTGGKPFELAPSQGN